MAQKRFNTIPALADTRQEMSGPLSVSLLDDWEDGERNLRRATALLSPYRREGIVAASDAAGLSRLTQERDLLEVLFLISQPKQILHALGKGIGGQAVGVWVADNSETFYPSEIEVDVVLSAAIEAQARIAERAAVMIGIALHAGVFYEIGGGLYGADARIVEILAEDHARAEEILLTSEVRQRLREPGVAAFERREDLDGLHASGVFSARSSRRFPNLRTDDLAYPHGFPPDFFAALHTIKDHAQRADLKPIYDAHERERFVVFLARERTTRHADDLAAILDDFLESSRMGRIIVENVHAPTHLVESGGGLAVLVFHNGREAYDFACTVRYKLHVAKLSVKIGIDRGSVLLFERTGGGFDGIFGDAINLASKISEDLGRPGRISITDRAAETIDGLSGDDRFSATISGIQVSGVFV
jgi:hypothetical protein